MARVNGYPLHPSEQDMISAVDIKDQALTIIVSMMLIELTLLRLGRAAFFQRLRCLIRKGSSYWSPCIRELGGRDARHDELGQEGEFKGAEYSEFRNPSVSGSPLEAEEAEKAGLGIKHPILQVAVCDGVESVNKSSNCRKS
jgi:hypothetical protein